MNAQCVPIKANILVAVFLLALSGVVQAQFTFTTNNGAITITGCSGNPVTLSIPGSTNGYPVTTIGSGAFNSLSKLTSITFPGSITNLSNGAFAYCSVLTGVYFQGNAPGLGGADVFFQTINAIVYYLPGTTGWSSRLSGQPTVLWNPCAQNDASFGVQNNQFGFNITGSSNLIVVVVAVTNLANPVWSPVSTNTLNTFIGTNGTSYFSDPQWTNYPRRFYGFRFP
jgi:hypothetical protein